MIFDSFRLTTHAAVSVAAVIAAFHSSTVGAQQTTAAAPSAQVATRKFGDLAEGPYRRLVIQNVMVIPGHGGPPTGPYDVLIEGNTISQMVPFDPVTAERRGSAQRMTGDRTIDGSGKYLMPGLADMHVHPGAPRAVNPDAFANTRGNLSRTRHHEEFIVLHVFHHFADVQVRVTLRSHGFAVVRYAPVVTP